MPGKALSILALSLMLDCFFAGVRCQAAKSYNANASATPYKQQLHQKHKYRRLNSTATATAGVKNHPASAGNVSKDSQVLNSQALDPSRVNSSHLDPSRVDPLLVDSSLAYKGLTHATVLAALKANHFTALVTALDQGIDIRFEGDALQLAVWRHSAGSARDLKIDTVLLAQAINQHFPGVFEQFDCTFFDPLSPNHSQRATLKMSKLSAFAHDKIDDEQLLCAVQLGSERDSSVRERYEGLSYSQILDQSAVLEGAYSDERKELSDELTTLKANGYDVNQATRQFFALEDLVRTRQYERITAAFARTRQCIAEAVAKAQGISVASSRMGNWQR